MKKLWIIFALLVLLTGCNGSPAVTPAQTTETTQPAPVFSPEAQVLYDKYQGLLGEPDTNWRSPALEEMKNTLWYYDGYDEAGNFTVYEMKLHTETMDVRWLMPDGEEKTYQAAPWSLETRGNIVVLTVDFQEFAGIKEYNLLINPDFEMMYIALDITSGDILSVEMPQFRFLQKHVQLQPQDMVGHWARTHTEVEGDRVETPKGDCTIHITNEADFGFRLSYQDKNFPEYSFQDAEMTILPPEDMACFEGCTWMGKVEAFDDTTRYIAVKDGTLMLVNCFTVDGAPAVSYEWFSRE